MSLVPFWALSVALLSMEGLRALGFHHKYLNLCSEDNKGLTGLEQHEGEQLQNIYFWVNFPFKIHFFFIFYYLLVYNVINI